MQRVAGLPEDVDISNERYSSMDKSQFTVIKLYRDSLRLADYISSKSNIPNHRAGLYSTVRAAFRANINETNEAKIEEQKDAAIRGLSNYMFHAAQEMAKENQAKGVQEPSLQEELERMEKEDK